MVSLVRLKYFIVSISLAQGQSLRFERFSQFEFVSQSCCMIIALTNDITILASRTLIQLHLHLKITLLSSQPMFKSGHHLSPLLSLQLWQSSFNVVVVTPSLTKMVVLDSQNLGSCPFLFARCSPKSLLDWAYLREQQKTLHSKDCSICMSPTVLDIWLRTAASKQPLRERCTHWHFTPATALVHLV